MKNYIENAIRTEAPITNEVIDRMRHTARLQHAADGLVTESGEIVDALKRHHFYGTELDTVNLKEEIGDIMWYVAIACDYLGVSLEEVCEKNIAKLKARYPNKFTEEDAVNRNLEQERKELE